jgi:hypothetical protein
MFLTYFDESKNEEGHDYYHIGAVAVAEEDLNLVEDRVAAIAEDSFGAAALSSDTELHATEVYHRKRNFKDWPDFDRRMAVLRRLIEVLSMPEVLLLRIRVNCAKLYGGVVPSDVAFMFLVERANDLVLTWIDLRNVQRASPGGRIPLSTRRVRRRDCRLRRRRQSPSGSGGGG